jgi:multicomponent K+:H+ antiporter subunit E
MIRKLVPYPVLMVCLLGTWLLLNQSISAGHIVLGAALALGGVWTFRTLEPPPLRLKGFGTILSLILVVAGDIVRSNIAVAIIVLKLRKTDVTSGFVDIPIELVSPYALVTLAIIITSTPGTLWVKFDAGAGILTIHVLDLIDEEEWITTIKDRYERRLREIFE